MSDAWSFVASIPLALLLIGSLVYCALSIVAVRHYLAVRPPPLKNALPVSILKPLAGVDLGFEENVRSFFEQDYPEFEILFAVREADDHAVEALEKIQRQFPHVPSRLIVTGEPPYPSSKVHSLSLMTARARHDLLVMSDSDMRATPGLLKTLAAEFQDPQVGLVTCPYRAVPGRSYWSVLEAIGMNTEFLGQVLVARMIEGMKFALGPTIAARKQALERIGGWDHLRDYLAEDFVLGKLVAGSGYRVLLSSYVIEHHIGSASFRENWKHRMRWVRSTRRSRPKGYVGQVFTNPLPLAILLCAVRPSWWPLAALALLLRVASAWAVAGSVLGDPLTRRRWWDVLVQDILSFVVWLAGFFGNTILWRGRKYYLRRDGKFELVQPHAERPAPGC